MNIAGFLDVHTQYGTLTGSYRVSAAGFEGTMNVDLQQKRQKAVQKG